MSGVRVRFAPSPTGALHLGNVRTALFNYLYARRHRGAFIFRIEDTDRERSSTDLERGIIDNLHWMGITADEGIGPGGEHGPYRQTERSEIYARYFDQLLETGKAYPCYCTLEELDAERELARREGRAYRYSGRCRDLTGEERQTLEKAGRIPTLRFRVPDGQTSFRDEIRGEISFHHQGIGDFVIRRSDGSALYNIANVIDDALMEVSHVIRGEEFISTTPTQILLQHALGFGEPRYAHLPLLLSPSGKGKLSKRETAVAVQDYRDQGYLPEAMVNFLVLLGWSPPGEKDIFTLPELEQIFDFDHVQKAGAQVDFAKLKHLNGVHIRHLTVTELTDRLRGFVPDRWYEDRPKLEQSLQTVHERLKLLSEAETLLSYYFDAPPAATLTPEQQALLREVGDRLEGASDFREETLRDLLHRFLDEKALGPKDLFPLLRLVLTGQKDSPSIPEILAALGPEETLARIQRSLT